MKNDDARDLQQCHCAGSERECINFVPVSLSPRQNYHTYSTSRRKKTFRKRTLTSHWAVGDLNPFISRKALTYAELPHGFWRAYYVRTGWVAKAPRPLSKHLISGRCKMKLEMYGGESWYRLPTFHVKVSVSSKATLRKESWDYNNYVARWHLHSEVHHSQAMVSSYEMCNKD